MNIGQTAFKVRAQLERFLGMFSPRFSRPAVTFLEDMLCGLQASRDVKLGCIVRGLNEAILPKKTEGRQSRNLQREGLVVPLRQRLWSCEAPGFTGENDRIKSVIGTASAATMRRGIYVIDRGGHRGIVIGWRRRDARFARFR